MDEFGCSSAALSREQKNEISHRGKALRAMKDILLELLDSIVVCNDNIKDYFLKKIFQKKKLLNIKFKSFTSFKETIAVL